jgi:hypothetical protein
MYALTAELRCLIPVHGSVPIVGRLSNNPELSHDLCNHIYVAVRHSLVTPNANGIAMRLFHSGILDFQEPC